MSKRGDRRRQRRRAAAKSPARRAGVGPAPTVPRLETAPLRIAQRLQPLLSLMSEVATAGDDGARETAMTDEQLVTFDLAILIRGINALKAARLLVAEGFWEAATSQTRQLFELLVNMEYLASLDRRAGTLDYARFGLLQEVRAQIAAAEYRVATGRAVDTRRQDELSRLLRSEQFSDFRAGSRADGTPRWKPSWTGKSTRALADLSPSAIRRAQYINLYAEWSEELHAAPGALLDSMFRRTESGWRERLFQTEEEKLVSVANMAIVLFIELWRSLPHVHQSSPQAALDWIERLQRHVGTLLDIDIDTERAIYLRSRDSE